MKKVLRLFISFFLVQLLLTTSINSYGLSNLEAGEVDELLKKISVYEYGESREPLSRFSDIVKSYLNTPDPDLELELKILKVLESDAAFDGKQFLCKELSVIGTYNSLPALLKMLKESETADMARYALERIPGEKVNEALREIITKSEDETKIGIINSLGMRKDAMAVGIFADFLKNSDSKIAVSAASALGKVANNSAIEILSSAKNEHEGKLRLVIIDSYLLCADKLAAENKTDEALKIYEELLNSNETVSTRRAAITGVILNSGDNTAEIILGTLKGTDDKIKPVAASMVRELDDPKDFVKVSELLPELSHELQVQINSAFEDIGDPSVHDHIIKAADTNDDEVRIAALKTLRIIGNSSDVEFLAATAANSRGEVQETAQQTLDLLNAPNTNQTILSLIKTSEPNIQVELIRSAGERMIVSGFDILYSEASSTNARVRAESYKSLAVISESSHLPQLIDLLFSAPDEKERRRIEVSLTKVSLKISDEDKRADIFLDKLSDTEDAGVKSSFIRILGSTGDPKALDHLREGLESDEDELKRTAIQSLTNWPTDAPLEDLLNVIKTSDNETIQILALRSFVNIIKANPDRDEDQTVELYETALMYAKDEGEKRMILSGLSEVHSLSSLKIVTVFLDNDTLRPEAETAVIKIADNMYEDHPEEIKKSLEKMLEKVTDKRLKFWAEELLKEIENMK